MMSEATAVINEVEDAKRVAEEAAAAVDNPETRTVTGDKGRGHYLDPAGNTMSGRLAGGYLAAPEKLYKEFVVREMTGAEEDMLIGKGSVLPRINQVITNCLISIGPITDRAVIAQAVQDMPTADREAVLLTLRRLSLGDAYVLPITCPDDDCKKEDKYTIDLGKLEVRDMPNPTVRQYRTKFLKEDGKTPTGRECLWHIMTGSDEEWMAEISKKRREKDGVSLSFLARIEEIGGVRIDREKYDDAMPIIKAMPVSERNQIRDLVEEYEGGVDTTIEFECKECKHEWKGVIPVASPAFFFPSVLRRR
jgi:hypothetical protein